MKNINEFVERFAILSYFDETVSYAMSSSMIFVEDKNGKTEVNDIYADDVSDCYNIVLEHLKLNAKRIYLIIDFAANPDLGINHDFICVYSFDHSGLNNIYAIQYNPKTGQKLGKIHQARLLDIIKDDFSVIQKRFNSTA